jgi:hypothetical protein
MQGLYINGSTDNSTIYTYQCIKPSLNSDCNATLKAKYQICVNNNIKGLKECGAGSCCGNITDLNTG